MSIEKEIKKKYIPNSNSMRIMAYDPYNFPISNANQHVWKYGQTVYVTPITKRKKDEDSFYFTHIASQKITVEETINVFSKQFN